MEKFIAFCKSYLAEILFVFVTLLCMALVTNGMICYEAWESGAMVVSAVIIQAVAGYNIQKLEKPAFPLSLLFTTVWYVCFVCTALTLVVCSIIVYPTEKLIYYIMLDVSFVAFVAMFGHLIIVSDRPDCKTSADD